MKDQTYVFDFDGTCTVPLPGAEDRFLNEYLVDFAHLLGGSCDEVTARFLAARCRIVLDPDVYGWQIDGRVVAPARVDLFVETRVCAELVLVELGENPRVWVERLEGLYRAHYLRHETILRPELLEVFRVLRSRGTPFFIVSNSDPAKVQQKLIPLDEDAAWVGERVRGFARKYVVTPDFALTPAVTTFPGLSREVWLSRRHYHDALVALIAKPNPWSHAQKPVVPWSELRVIGDIAELDLALPVSLGATGYLLTNPRTSTCERLWAESHPRVRVIADLREALEP